MWLRAGDDKVVQIIDQTRLPFDFLIEDLRSVEDVALAAADNDIPFYVALPSSTFDWTIRDGVREIPIEMRDGSEVQWVEGKAEDGNKRVRITPEDSPAENYAFDITPARLVSGLITERGVCNASESSVLGLFPEHAKAESKI